MASLSHRQRQALNPLLRALPVFGLEDVRLVGSEDFKGFGDTPLVSSSTVHGLDALNFTELDWQGGFALLF